jgi:hypothetical protein
MAIAGCLASLAGCEIVSGLDQVRESPCAPSCDAGAKARDAWADHDGAPSADASGRHDAQDAATDVAADQTTYDGSSPRDGATADASEDAAADAPGEPSDGADGTDGTGASADATDDGAAVDGAADATNDAQADSPEDTDAACTLGTTDNCGACGNKCGGSPSASAASCVGNTCTYQCNSGYLDCNSKTYPSNTDGCECATPGSRSASCCGPACPTQHTTGFPRGLMSGAQIFYDCNTSINEEVAMEACTAYTGSVAQCGQTGSCVAADGGASADLAVCSLNDAQHPCTCWTYQGDHVGRVSGSGVVGKCVCASGAAGERTYH